MYELKGTRWIDLSHTVQADMPCDPALTLPQMEFFSQEGQGTQLHNLEVIHYCPHTGTHIDAPFHVCSKWSSMETLDPTILIGPATVITLKVPEGDYAVTREDLIDWEQENGSIQTENGVLLHTGHADTWKHGREHYIDQGYIRLSRSAAEYLVEKKARFIGIESVSVDGEDTEVHKYLMEHGTYIVENVCNLDQIGTVYCNTVGTFPAVQGASGSWVRLLALV